jgi:hypothetical protein
VIKNQVSKNRLTMKLSWTLLLLGNKPGHGYFDTERPQAIQEAMDSESKKRRNERNVSGN